MPPHAEQPPPYKFGVPTWRLITRIPSLYRAKDPAEMHPQRPDTAGSIQTPTKPAQERLFRSSRATLEDAYAILVGCLLVVAGLVLLAAGGLVTGGLAGVALLLSYVLPLSPGIALMLLSLPFFVLAGRTMGIGFLIKTVLASICLSAFSALTPLALKVTVLSKGIAAIAAGAMIGMGSLALARHGAGVGGLGVLFLWLERRRGWNPGRCQLVADALVFLLSIAIIAPQDLLWSSLSTVTMSIILILWQRPATVGTVR